MASQPGGCISPTPMGCGAERQAAAEFDAFFERGASCPTACCNCAAASMTSSLQGVSMVLAPSHGIPIDVPHRRRQASPSDTHCRKSVWTKRAVPHTGRDRRLLVQGQADACPSRVPVPAYNLRTFQPWYEKPVKPETHALRASRVELTDSPKRRFSRQDDRINRIGMRLSPPPTHRVRLRFDGAVLPSAATLTPHHRPDGL